ncbi:hypothetical protein BDR22DRAFT_895561 [Usnea florida]
MLSGASQEAAFFRRIDRWNQEVVKNTLQEASTRQVCSQKLEPHRMKLRSREKRQLLGQVSGNSNPRKRKASVTMPDQKQGKKAMTDKDHNDGPPRRGPGRPRKNPPVDIEEDESLEQSVRRRQGRPVNAPESSNSGESALAIRTHFPPPQISRPSSTSPSKDSKRGQILLGKLIPEVAIDMNYLKRCDPPVDQTLFRTMMEMKTKIPLPVADLFEKLEKIPRDLIPAALEHLYEQDADTPRKSMAMHAKPNFLHREKTPFPANCLGRMKETADAILEKSEYAASENAHERQWGVLVNQLLCELDFWQRRPRQVMVLNVETCSIQPLDIRPKKPSPSQNVPIDCDGQSETSDSKKRMSLENVGRMVDLCLALRLNPFDIEVINDVFAKISDYAASLN